MLTIGVDSGSVATKGVLFDGCEIRGLLQIPTGWSPKESALQAYEELLRRHGVSAVQRVVGTGYGRITMDFAQRTITEITCHAKGVYMLNPEVRAVIDIGGQDSKVMALNEKGSVREFQMNDKCAAGTGRFLQNTLVQLGEDIVHLDALADHEEPQKISSMCTVFAESEIVSLLAGGVSKGSIAAGLAESVAERVAALFARIRSEGVVAFTGGVSRSEVIRKALEMRIGQPLYRPELSPFTGAIGAAVLAFQDLSATAESVADVLPE